MDAFRSVKDRLVLLLDWNTKIANPALPHDVRDLLKNQVQNKIEEGKRVLGLDIVLRSATGEPLTFKNTPMVALYRRYRPLLDRMFTVSIQEASAK